MISRVDATEESREVLGILGLILCQLERAELDWQETDPDVRLS